MIAAENVARSYFSRKASQNWGKWAQDNPQMDKLLIEVEILINASGNGQPEDNN